jgi:hypothetical protein
MLRNSLRYLAILLCLVVGLANHALGQSTGWLANDAIVTAERTAKATWKIAAAFTDAANLFVVAKPVGGSARLDLTPIMAIKDGTLELDLALIGVPVGKYDLEISTLSAGGQIQVLANTKLDVTPVQGGAPDDSGKPNEATMTTAVTSSIKLKLDLGLRSQIYERRNTDAGVSTRPTFGDLTMEGGFETLHTGEDWEVKSAFSFTGNSNRNEAVQFSNKGPDASKIDLTNYLIEGGRRDIRFAAGNINVSTHPLLVQGISNRGVSVNGRLPYGIDVNASIQNGGGVQAGLDNPLGISQANNMFRQLGLGFDLDPDRPGKARFDVTGLMAHQKVGILTTGGDAIERSDGYGVRLAGRNNDGRGRLEMTFASSAQTPAGGTVVNKGMAWTSEIGYDVVKDWALRPEIPVSLNTGVRVEHSSPVYRSLGSSYGSNYHQTAALANLKLGPSAVQAQITRRFDNVDKDAAYIRNKVDSWALNANFPLDQFVKAWIGKPEPPPAPAAVNASDAKPDAAKPETPKVEEPKPNPYWPALTYARKSVLGYGDPAFIPSGYTIADLPRVQVTEQSWGLKWTFERVAWGIKRISVLQDNQQPGFTGEDVKDVKWGYSMDLKVTEALNVGASYDLGNNLRYVSGVVADQLQTKLAATYNITPESAVLGELNRQVSRDTAGALTTQRGMQWQLTHKFKTPALGSFTALPAQLYLRWLAADGYTAQTSGISLKPITSAVQFGMTVAIF